MNHDFTLAGSEPVSWSLDMTITDPEEFKRIFEPTHRPAMRFTGLKPYITPPCPVCGGPVDGYTINDATVTRGERPGTYDLTGTSVTYSPCDHEAPTTAEDAS